jgi:phage gp45-like
VGDVGVADELLHQMKHAAEQQSGGYRPFLFAHVSSYDPKLHRVRLVVPSLADEANNYVLTGWMPLGLVAGVQYAPKGGATVINPTGGEPCVVGIIERERGTCFVASMIGNQISPPAFTDLQPGEVGIKASTGSFVRLKADNSIAVTSPGKVVVTASEVDIVGNTVITGNLNISGTMTWSNGTLSGTGAVISGNLTATGDVTAGQSGVDQVGLRSHVHAGVLTGGASTAAPTPGT